MHGVNKINHHRRGAERDISGNTDESRLIVRREFE
jgi:hypothetical protein